MKGKVFVGRDGLPDVQLVEHSLLAPIHPAGSWTCRCGITVSFSSDPQEALQNYQQHLLEADAAPGASLEETEK